MIFGVNARGKLGCDAVYFWSKEKGLFFGEFWAMLDFLALGFVL